MRWPILTPVINYHQVVASLSHKHNQKSDRCHQCGISYRHGECDEQAEKVIQAHLEPGFPFLRHGRTESTVSSYRSVHGVVGYETEDTIAAVI